MAHYQNASYDRDPSRATPADLRRLALGIARLDPDQKASVRAKLERSGWDQRVFGLVILNALRVGQASLPVEPREFSYSRHHPRFGAALALTHDVQIKVVRARTLAHRDRQGRLSYSLKRKRRRENR